MSHKDKANETSFKPGRSGNPGGATKEQRALQREVREAALKWCPKAITRLVELLDSDDPRVAIVAANSLLDRGLGKPAQAIVATGDATGFFDALASALNNTPALEADDNGSGTEAGAPEGGGGTVQ